MFKTKFVDFLRSFFTNLRCRPPQVVRPLFYMPGCCSDLLLDFSRLHLPADGGLYPYKKPFPGSDLLSEVFVSDIAPSSDYHLSNIKAISSKANTLPAPGEVDFSLPLELCYFRDLEAWGEYLHNGRYYKADINGCLEHLNSDLFSVERKVYRLPWLEYDILRNVGATHHFALARYFLQAENSNSKYILPDVAIETININRAKLRALMTDYFIFVASLYPALPADQVNKQVPDTLPIVLKECYGCSVSASLFYPDLPKFTNQPVVCAISKKELQTQHNLDAFQYWWDHTPRTELVEFDTLLFDPLSFCTKAYGTATTDALKSWTGSHNISPDVVNKLLIETCRSDTGLLQK